MTNIKKKAVRAEIIADMEQWLLSRINSMREDAKWSLDNCKDEETGEIITDGWRYADYVEKTEKAEVIESVLKELEKF